MAAWLAPGGKPGAPFTGEQTPAGFAALQRRLQATGHPPTATLVVLEATGNSWVALAIVLHEAGYRVAVVNPRQAHHFAKAQLRRAKTDALDARDLAQLAATLRPAPWTPPPAVYHEVRQRLVARDGLLAMRTQARNQRHALLQWPVVVAGVRQHLDELIADLAALAAGAEAFCAQVRTGLADATFAQRRALVELLIDRVVVTAGAVEIRYAIPTSRDGPHHSFCRLRKDYRELLLQAQAIPRPRHALRQDRPPLPRRRLPGRHRHLAQLRTRPSRRHATIRATTPQAIRVARAKGRALPV